MKILGKIRLGVNYLYTKHLLATNVVSVGGLLGLGDAVIQHMGLLFDNDSEARYDYARTGRMIAVGFALGPFNHYWYTFLDKFVVGQGMKVVGKKIMCDQFVAGPFFCTTFLFGTTLLEGNGVSGAMAEWKAKFLHIYMVDWAFWPAAQLINFRFLPTRFRVLYVSLATLVWNSFLSYVKHSEIDSGTTVQTTEHKKMTEAEGNVKS